MERLGTPLPGPTMSPPFDLAAFFAAAPVPPRVLAGAAGLLLLCVGGRLYRLAVILPGLLLGLGGGLLLANLISGTTPVIVGLAILGGVGGGLLAHFLERFAVVGAGVIAGLAGADIAWPLVSATPPAWYLWPLAALVGGALMPLIWKAALVPLTAGIGAYVLVDVAGYPRTPVTVGALAAVGLIIQVVIARRAPAKAEKKGKDKGNRASR